MQAAVAISGGCITLPRLATRRSLASSGPSPPAISISASSKPIALNFKGFGSSILRSPSICAVFPRRNGGERSDLVVVRAAAEEAAGAGEVEVKKVGNVGETLQLGLLFGLWYLFNIYFNIYNKQVSCFYAAFWIVYCYLIIIM
ncbi:hypothetical protein Droror1_Dr00012378 [Drosera rotundifolia]